MVEINASAIRKPWSVVKGFVSSTFLLLKDGISVVGEINRRSIQARIPMDIDLPFGLEVESAGFSNLIGRYDKFFYDADRNLFVTSDGEFGIIVKQDTEGILEEMAKMEIGEESTAVDISAILPSLSTMSPIMATSTRAILFAKDDILATTDGRRATVSYIPELKDWQGDETKGIPGELMMLARRASSCSISFTDEAIIGDIDGCRIYQERITPSEYGVGNTIVKREWVDGYRLGTGKVFVNSEILLDGIKFVSGFADKSSKVVSKVTLTFSENEIQISSGKGKKSVPILSNEGLVGTKTSLNMEYLMDVLNHVGSGDISLSLKENGVGAVILDRPDNTRASVLMTLTSAEG
jgi:hypothetical protein